jgi:hypothetical protein
MNLSAAQIAALEQLAAGLATVFNPAAGAAVGAAESIANQFIPGMKPASPAPEAPPLGAVPATDVQPVKADPDVHPVLASQGLAPVSPTPTTAGAVPAPDDMNFPDLYARVGAIEQKLNAAIAAMGLQGSAAMAAHP